MFCAGGAKKYNSSLFMSSLCPVGVCDATVLIRVTSRVLLPRWCRFFDWGSLGHYFYLQIRLQLSKLDFVCISFLQPNALSFFFFFFFLKRNRFHFSFFFLDEFKRLILKNNIFFKTLSEMTWKRQSFSLWNLFHCRKKKRKKNSRLSASVPFVVDCFR